MPRPPAPHLGGHSHLPAPRASSDSREAVCLVGSLLAASRVSTQPVFFMGSAKEAAPDPRVGKDDSVGACGRPGGGEGQEIGTHCG